MENFLTILSVVLTIIAVIINLLFNFKQKKSRQIVIQNLENALRQIENIINSEIQAMDYLDKNSNNSISDKVKKLLCKVVQILAEPLRAMSRAEVNVSIKTIVDAESNLKEFKSNSDKNLMITTLVSSSSKSRFMENINTNSSYASILYGFKKFYAINDLREFVKNTNKTGDLYLNDNPNWATLYNATIVVPLIDKNLSTENEVIYMGFLCVDFSKRLPKKMFEISLRVVNLVGAFLSNYLSKIRLIANQVDEKILRL